MDKTKVKLRICDIDCTITSDDNEEYVRTIGDEIDRAISAVLKKKRPYLSFYGRHYHCHDLL